MIELNKKISMKQAVVLLLAMTYSPSLRFIPLTSIKYAKQAAWLSPLISSLILLLLVFVIDRIYKKYKDKEVSLMDIIYNVFGKIGGKVTVFLFLIYTSINLAYYARIYCERFASNIFINVDIKVFLITMLIFIAVVLRHGLVVIARMGEIIFAVLLCLFITITILGIPNIVFYRLTPISTDDILPIVKGSMGSTGIYTSFTLIFLFSDKISNISAIKKTGIQLTTFYTMVIPVLVAGILGTLGYSTVQRSLDPFLISVKLISLFDTIERIESVVVAIWVFSDFVLLCMFTYINIHLIKSLFNLKEEKYVYNIYLSFIFVFALGFIGSKFELEDFAEAFLLPLNLFFTLILPILIFLVGKLRRKV